MAKMSFERDVKPLFAKYVDDMKDVQLSTPSGTGTLHLGNYESVKRFYYEIQVAIHGYDFDRAGNLRPGAKPLQKRDGEPGDYVTSAPHPMPNNPYGWPEELIRLPQVAIDTYDQWVADGMLA